MKKIIKTIKPTGAVIKLKRHVLLGLCAFALLLSALLAGGAVELLAKTYNFIFADIIKPDTPLGAEYELQTSPPYTVAIDAGHGNMDTGAKGIVKEIEITEPTAQALYELLCEDENFAPFLVRQVGEEIKSTERALRAINAKASLFMSIHANSDFSQGSSYGFECYPTPPGRKYSEQSMQFAQYLTARMKEAGHRIRGENGIKFAYYNGKSKKIVDSTNVKLRTQKSFGVVEKPLCPSVLVEQCFITNRKDVNEWGSDEGCKKAARVYYEAICDYFGTQPLKSE